MDAPRLGEPESTEATGQIKQEREINKAIFTVLLKTVWELY